MVVAHEQVHEIAELGAHVGLMVWVDAGMTEVNDWAFLVEKGCDGKHEVGMFIESTRFSQAAADLNAMVPNMQMA